MLKRNWALIAFVYLALAEALSLVPVPDLSLCLIQPEHSEQAANHDDKKYCPAFHTGAALVFERVDSFLEHHDKSVVGGFTIVLAISTIGLWLATNKLWVAGERQFFHIQSEAEATDFHRTTQFEQISRQIAALQQSAEAAEDNARETQRLVWTAESTAIRQLRAYIVADVVGVKFQLSENGRVWPDVQVTIKNTGQTPAHEVKVISNVALLEHPIKLPFDFTLGNVPDPSVAVLGAGEFSESPIGPEEPFDGNEMMAARDRESGRRIYAWGTITYRDVFGGRQYTNFCGSILFMADGSHAGRTDEHHNDAS
jgi:hypothetical protein